MDAPETDPCSACLSRRSVLRAGATGATVALLASLPVAGCMSGGASPSGPVAAGQVADIQIGTLKVIAGASVILGRDPMGLYAMTQVCTHQGQLVEVVTVAGVPALHCYGHGSDFTMNGAVTHGPAGSPLEHFKVEVADDGSITIQGGTLVAATERTEV